MSGGIRCQVGRMKLGLYHRFLRLVVLTLKPRLLSQRFAGSRTCFAEFTGGYGGAVDNGQSGAKTGA